MASLTGDSDSKQWHAALRAVCKLVAGSNGIDPHERRALAEARLYFRAQYGAETRYLQTMDVLLHPGLPCAPLTPEDLARCCQELIEFREHVSDLLLYLLDKTSAPR